MHTWYLLLYGEGRMEGGWNAEYYVPPLFFKKAGDKYPENQPSCVKINT